MADHEKQKVDQQLRKFAARNFERPDNCRNLEQIRYYVRELCLRIEELEKRFQYVPGWAYTLLAQYNAKQNMMLHREFVKSYC